MAQLRLAVIGAGLIGREHCALIRDHPRASLVALADISPDAERYAASVEAKYFADYEAMLDEIRPDGAIVALPNVLHEPAARA